MARYSNIGNTIFTSSNFKYNQIYKLRFKRRSKNEFKEDKNQKLEEKRSNQRLQILYCFIKYVGYALDSNWYFCLSVICYRLEVVEYLHNT